MLLRNIIYSRITLTFGQVKTSQVSADVANFAMVKFGYLVIDLQIKTLRIIFRILSLGYFFGEINEWRHVMLKDKRNKFETENDRPYGYWRRN